MIDEEIIEKIYDVASVEGISWFSDNGELAENQLSISEAAVQKIGTALLGMRSNLSQVQRELKGLVLKSERQTFLNFFHGNNLLLVEIDASAKIDVVYQALKSQLGEPAPKKKTLPNLSAGVNVAQNIASQQAAAEPAPAQEVEEIAGGISWTDFQKQLNVPLKKVAPAQLAKKIIKQSSGEVGIADTAAQITPEQASALAHAVSEKIPNAARREMLQKELTTLLAKLSA